MALEGFSVHSSPCYASPRDVSSLSWQAPCSHRGQAGTRQGLLTAEQLSIRVPVAGAPGGRTWWAHFEFPRINITRIIRRKKMEELRTFGAYGASVRSQRPLVNHYEARPSDRFEPRGAQESSPPEVLRSVESHQPASA
jgi:hypothetical protein